MPRPRLLQAPLLAASRPPSSRSCAATSAKRAHSSAKKNRNREKPEPEYRGPHPLDIILGEKKGREFLEQLRARARACFLGYETSKDARRLKLSSKRRVSVCKSGADTPSSGQSSKLSE